jgi:hypothetical protein
MRTEVFMAIKNGSWSSGFDAVYYVSGYECLIGTYHLYLQVKDEDNT